MSLNAPPVTKSINVAFWFSIIVAIGAITWAIFTYVLLWNHSMVLASILVIGYVAVQFYKNRKGWNRWMVMKTVGFLLFSLAVYAHSWVFIIIILLAQMGQGVWMGALEKKAREATSSEQI